MESDKKNEIVSAGEEATEVTVSPQQPVSTWRPQDADREVIKANIRRRVWTSNASPKAQFIPAKPLPTVQDDGQKTVAVYARVSTKSTEQVSSIENQTRYYTEKVEKTPNWEMLEIYSDEGISGVSIKKRPAFLRMIKDATEKKMDLILCASVSRFARNMSECLDQIQLLKTKNPSHPVGVYFETENIYTLDPRSSDQLQIHAMLADWESTNKSRRMILSYDQRISTGQYPVLDLLGYKHTEDGQLVIVEDQATTVRFIFLAYIVGYTLKEIAEILTEKERPTLRGNTEWTPAMV
ncbi:MAG: recombinase family protein, partial [Oscillospiraceae bacterium]|nr:recombinase family protein [Oscillospiraceae bacterium]